MIYGTKPIVTNGLVFAVDAKNTISYPGSGTVWNDISGYNSTGTLTNGPTFDLSYGGNISLDGTNDFVSFPTTVLTTAGLTGQTAKTIEIWMTCDSIASTFRFAFAMGSPSTGQAFFIGRNAGTLYYGGYGSDFTISNFFNDKVGIPLHLVLTYNGTTAIGYYNGVQHASSVRTWSMGSTYLRIGQQVNNFGEFWTGKVFSARIYNRALSTQEITQNYNSTKTRFGL